MVEWNSGMEWLNSGVTTPIERLCDDLYPLCLRQGNQDTAAFSNHGKPVMLHGSKEIELKLILQEE